MNKKETLVQRYLTYLEHGEIDKIVSLFSKGSMVKSPLYGEKTARQFYEALKRETQQSVLTY
ncbi:MAG: hypothetical protein OIF50_02650 [Flavobacteriaceae bacterium]|nr:hypothetical protein [Flavobacteriaceae bacterium]